MGSRRDQRATAATWQDELSPRRPAAIARRLARITDNDGVVRLLSLDDDGGARDLATVLRTGFSGVLLGPGVALGAVLDQLDAGTGVVTRAGPVQLDDRRQRGRRDDSGAATAVRSGADALSLLVPWDGRRAGRSTATAQRLVADVHEHGLPVVLGPTSGQGLPETGEWVVDWVQAHRGVGADLLMLPHPGSQRSCERVTAVTSGSWIVRSSGVDSEQFVADAFSARSGGASGYAVDVALWRQARSRGDRTRSEDGGRTAAWARTLLDVVR